MEVRPYRESDVPQIKAVVKVAFAGFPWLENLSDEEVNKRWLSQSAKPGFECFVIDIEGEIAGGIWWDTPSIDDFEAERGKRLADFARKFFPGGCGLVWEREVVVHPKYQGKNLGNLLRSAFLCFLQLKNQKFQVLTRMRDDNTPILRIAEKFGFVRSGIRVESSQIEGVFHEYWFKLVG